MSSSERPNILMVLTDQQHLSGVGCYDGQPSFTPQADAIATQGTRFTSAFCHSPLCSPSRAALFTGLLSHRFGEVKNDLTIPAGTPHLASLLNGAGYRLGYAGKWHADARTVPTSLGFEGRDHPGYGFPFPLYLSPVDPAQMVSDRNPYYEYLMERGYDVPLLANPLRTWTPERRDTVYPLYGRLDCPVEATIPYYVGDEAVRLVRSFCSRRDQDGQPFFAWVNFWGPHNPCYIPEPYWSLVDPVAIDRPASAEDALTGKPHTHERLSKYWGVHDAPWSFWQGYLAAYFGYCRLIDDQVRRILGVLTETQADEDTIVIFASDHGDMMGRHRLLDKGPFSYDDIYRVPLLVGGPRVRTGACDEFVYLHDLFPTILGMAGVEIPPCDGASLLPLLSDDEGWQSRDEVFGEFDYQICASTQRVVRTRTHKFVFNASDTCELYDLMDDPDELHNRVNDPALTEVKEELKGRLLAHLVATDDVRAAFHLEAVRWAL